MKRIITVSLTMSVFTAAICAWGARRLSRTLVARPDRGDTAERGDVPGWVLVTLMTALLVAGLLAIAWPALQDLLNQALEGLSL